MIFDIVESNSPENQEISLFALFLLGILAIGNHTQKQNLLNLKILAQKTTINNQTQRTNTIVARSSYSLPSCCLCQHVVTRVWIPLSSILSSPFCWLLWWVDHFAAQDVASLAHVPDFGDAPKVAISSAFITSSDGGGFTCVMFELSGSGKRERTVFYDRKFQRLTTN